MSYTVWMGSGDFSAHKWNVYSLKGDSNITKDNVFTIKTNFQPFYPDSEDGPCLILDDPDGKTVDKVDITPLFAKHKSEKTYKLKSQNMKVRVRISAKNQA